tara:strand:- start:324 stop:557 length:234 start_codon:yes stop_codon:yes gene_type:complete
MEKINKIKSGDVFEIYGGANNLGRGRQLLLVNYISGSGTVWCQKFSMKGKLLAKKFKLNQDDVIKPRPDLEIAIGGV